MVPSLRACFLRCAVGFSVFSPDMSYVTSRRRP
jgi:hypothetical protein